MTTAAARRGPRTFAIYGASVAIIGGWWGVLWALGMAGEPDGTILLGVVALLALGFAMLRDPWGMLCLVVFALPFSLGILQFEVGVITLNPYTIGITAAALLALGGAALGAFRYRYAVEDVFVALLGGAFLVSTLLARDLIQAGFLAFHGVFIPIMTYLALKSLVRTQDQYLKVLVAFVAGVTAFALYGLVVFIGDPQRLYVLSVPPISAAALMTAALVILAYSGWWRTKLGLAAAFLLLAGLLATFSRGYLLLLLLSPLVFRWIRRGGAGKLMVSMLAASLVGTLLFVSSYELFYVKVDNREQEQTAERVTDVQFWLSSLYGRARYYAVGLQEFSKSPLIGNGFHQNFEAADGKAVVWHNFHVEWLEYGGLLAYSLYVGLLVLHYRAMARLARTQRLVAINLTIMFLVLVNGLMNSFTAGLSPVIGFLFMALNRAQATIAATHRPG